jgi:hypothetical protein
MRKYLNINISRANRREKHKCDDPVRIAGYTTDEAVGREGKTKKKVFMSITAVPRLAQDPAIA